MGFIFRINIVMLLGFLSFSASAQDACSEAYKQAQSACVARQQVLLQDSIKIQDSTSPLKDALTDGLTAQISTSQSICPNVLALCLKECKTKNKKNFEACSPEGALGKQHAQIKEQIKATGSKLIAGEKMDPKGKSISVEPTSGLPGTGVPADLMGPANSHSEMLRQKEGPGGGIRLVVPLGTDQ